MKKLITLLFLSLQISAQTTFKDYSPTKTGFSVLPTGQVARYDLDGYKCTIYINYSANGTSNATTKTITLPYTAANTVIQMITCRTVNNGAAADVGYVITTAGSNIAKVFRDLAGSNWTASGGARFQFGSFIYEVQKPSEHTVFFMGNSLMNYSQGNVAHGMRMPLTCYSSIIADSACSMQNYSVGGKTTTQMLAEFGTVLKPYLKNGDVVFVWEGANDLGTVDSTAAYNNLVAYCDSVHAYGGIAIIGTLIPSTNGNEANKLAVNRNILLNYAAFADTVCDFRTLSQFDSVSDAGNTTYYYDGTHQTQAGSDILGNFAAPEIKYFLRP